MAESGPDQKMPSIEWAIWFQWVLATTVGWIVGWAIGGELGIGTVIGIAQWFVLRRLVYQAGWWVLVSALGWTIGLTGILGMTVVGAVVGALTGFALDFLLRYPRSEVYNGRI